MFFLYRHLPKLPRLLESEDVNMRIAAGETIALLFELARDLDPVSLKPCCVYAAFLVHSQQLGVM